MGQQSISVLSLTFTASGTVQRRRAIGFNGAQTTAAGQKVMGVSPRDAADKTLSDVTVIGTEVIETGGAFAAGASLISDAQGRAVVAAGTAGEFIFADALEASSAAGSFVEVLLRRQGRAQKNAVFRRSPQQSPVTALLTATGHFFEER